MLPLRSFLRGNGLGLVLLALLAAELVGQTLTGLRVYTDEQVSHGKPPPTLGAFVGGAQFWFESLQNWQSEFLAVFAIVVLSIHLRQQGSPESKPVFAPHEQTGTP